MSGGAPPGSERYDVVVVGGGPAGIAAALASSALGARTLLLDRSPALGGNVSNAFVHTICGLYGPTSDGPPRYVNPGIASRLADHLVRVGGAGQVERAGRVYVLPIQPPVFEASVEALCAAQPGLRIRVGFELESLALAEDRDALHVLRARRAEIAGARGSGDEPRETLQAHARIAIDASGDGNAAALAGADVEIALPATLQNPSYIVRMAGARGVSFEGFERLKLSAAVARASRRGALPPGCESVLLRPGAEAGEAYVTVNLAKPEEEPFDPLDASQRARLEGLARERAEALVAFLRAEREGFEDLRVDAHPRRIGVREGRRVLGRSVLDADHVLEGRSHPGEVARSSWPIELWHGHERAHFEHVAGPAAIPLDALVSRTHPRLGAAGRCMSATHEALGALRVVGTALATGEVIGIAAALAADAGSSLAEVEPERVRKEREDLRYAGLEA